MNSQASACARSGCNAGNQCPRCKQHLCGRLEGPVDAGESDTFAFEDGVELVCDAAAMRTYLQHEHCGDPSVTAALSKYYRGGILPV